MIFMFFILGYITDIYNENKRIKLSKEILLYAHFQGDLPPQPPRRGGYN